MPTYEYRCDNCQHELEKFQSMSDSPLRKCPCCGKMKLKRLIGTGAGIIFKGSGFYQTDYRSDSYVNSAKKETTSASSKTDSKTGSKDNSQKPAKTPKDKKPSQGTAAKA